MSGEPTKLKTAPSDLSAWKEILHLCRIHAIVPMAYDALSRAENKNELDNGFLHTFRQEAISKIAVQTARTEEFARVYSLLEQNGISPTVLKGMALRLLYPKSDCRVSSDEDIFIPSEELAVLKRVLENEGYESGFISENGTVIHFMHRDTLLQLEVHTKLFETQAKAGDYAFLFERQLKTSKRGGYTVLEETDQLLYLICHAAKHFAMSGFGIRQICDIIIFTQKYYDTIDFDLLLAETERAQLHIFTASLMKIGEEYFEMIKVPEVFEKFARESEPLLCDVFEGGVFGHSSEERRQSARVTMNTVSGNDKAPVLGTLFPPLADMAVLYPELNTRPYLLAWYWGVRLIKRGAMRLISAGKSVSIGKKRSELLKGYGLGKKH